MRFFFCLKWKSQNLVFPFCFLLRTFPCDLFFFLIPNFFLYHFFEACYPSGCPDFLPKSSFLAFNLAVFFILLEGCDGHVISY